MRTAVLLSTVLLSTSLLAGCGSSGDSPSSSGYCKDLKAAANDFGFLTSDAPDYSHFADAVATIHGIAKEAPARVSAPWKTIDDLLYTLEKAMADAGISMKEFGALTQGTMPSGMTAEQMQQLAPKLEAALAEVDNEDLNKAGDLVTKDAKTNCHIDITQ
jgi:hypothetical protein